MGRRELSIFNFKFSIFNSNEEFLNMLIHIVGDGGRYLLFVLDEVVFQVIKLLILLIHGHELLIGALAREVLLVLVIYLLGLVDNLGELLHAPQAHRLGKGIVEDIGSVAILYQLAEAAVHQFLVQYAVAQQHVLASREARHRLGGELATNDIKVSIGKYLEECVHTLRSALAQHIVDNQSVHNIRIIAQRYNKPGGEQNNLLFFNPRCRVSSATKSLKLVQTD